LFVHFSGHGSQVQDLNGDEEDGLDETLVPYDGRTPGVPDIVDDELDEIFSHLHTTRVLIVLDSCHSGTATRAIEFRARGIPQDLRIDLYRTAGDGTRAIVPRVQSRLLVMSSAAENEEALDGPIEGEYHGLFTYALAKSLSNSAPGASPRDVFTGLEQEMARLKVRLGLGRMPEPQLEGPADSLDKPLLSEFAVGDSGAAESARLAWLTVQPAKAGQVTLVNGTVHGAAPGSVWAIYSPGETVFAPGGALATATVVDGTGVDAYASLQPANARAKPSSRAVMLMSDPGAQRIPIRLVDIPPLQQQRIETVLKKKSVNVEIVGADRAARFVIESREQSLRLLSADQGQVLATFDTHTDQWGTDAARVISRSTAASDLLALDNPTSQLTVHASVQGAATEAARDIVLVAKTNPVPLHIRGANEPRSTQDSLQISVSVSAQAYLTIVDVDSEGNTNLLFPNTYQRAAFWPGGRVPANTTVLIPDSLVEGSRAGFFWDYAPPAGLDTLRIFASTDAATAQLIRNRVRAFHKAPGGTRAMDAPLPDEDFAPLRQDLAALATRGIVTVKDQTAANVPPDPSQAPPDWNAVSITVAVSR
jgi:Caspase domain/Domain of unknown function (DUF4384)